MNRAQTEAIFLNESFQGKRVVIHTRPVGLFRPKRYRGRVVAVTYTDVVLSRFFRGDLAIRRDLIDRIALD